MPNWEDEMNGLSQDALNRLAQALNGGQQVATKTKSDNDKIKAAILKGLDELGKLTVGDDDLIYKGKQFVLPESVLRSEERRVGKECRSRWSPYH